MKAEAIKTLLFRFIGLTLCMVVPSFIVVVFNVKGVLETRNQVFLGMAVGIIIFFGYIIWSQRILYRDTLGKMLPYYATLIPFGMIAIITVILYVCVRDIYVWMFCITKIFNVFDAKISVKASIVLFYFIGFLMTCFSHLGLKQEVKEVRKAMREEAEVLGPEKVVKIEEEYEDIVDEEYEKNYKKYK